MESGVDDALWSCFQYVIFIHKRDGEKIQNYDFKRANFSLSRVEVSWKSQIKQWIICVVFGAASEAVKNFSVMFILFEQHRRKKLA